MTQTQICVNFKSGIEGYKFRLNELLQRTNSKGLFFSILSCRGTVSIPWLLDPSSPSKLVTLSLAALLPFFFMVEEHVVTRGPPTPSRVSSTTLFLQLCHLKVTDCLVGNFERPVSAGACRKTSIGVGGGGGGWRQDPALHELLVLNLMALLLQDPHPTYTRTDFIVLPFAQGSAQLIPLYLPHSQFMKQKQTHTTKGKQWGQFSAASGLTGEKGMFM